MEAVEDQPITVGLDVHKKAYSVALFSSQNGQVESHICLAGEAALAAQLELLGHEVEHVVYATGPTGFASARALMAAEFNVSVIAASRVPRGYAAAAKNNRLDAAKLATYFAGGLLRSVAILIVEQEGYGADRSVLAHKF